jgi:hypothetical protein
VSQICQRLLRNSDEKLEEFFPPISIFRNFQWTAMMELRLFSDRISHPCRACLLLLRCLEKPFHEQQLNLLRGDHFRREEVRPWKKVPVLQVGGRLF